MKKSERILIQGLPGTGKSTLAAYFRAKGKNAFDSDEAVARWVDKKTGRPRSPTKSEWLNMTGVSWRWNGKRLKRLLKSREVYIFGGADNTKDFLGLFDRVYYLDIGKELLLKRLNDPKRRHDFGRHAKQRNAIIGQMASGRKEAGRLGFRFVDASLPLERIFQTICQSVSERED